MSKHTHGEKISRATRSCWCFVASTIHFPSLGRGSSLPPSPSRRIIPSPPCLFGTGHTDASLHFALALLLQVQSPHCYNGWPLLALLPVLLLLSLLLPVAADRRMETRRASCFVECRIRGKLHSLRPASCLIPSFFHHVALGRAFHSFSSRLVTSRVPFFSKLFNFKSVRSVRSDSFARYFFLLFFYLHTVTVFFQFLQIPSISICFDNSESKIRRSESFSLNRGKEGGKAIEKSTVNREMYN